MMYNTRAEPLFRSLNLFLGDFIVAVVARVTYKHFILNKNNIVSDREELPLCSLAFSD